MKDYLNKMKEYVDNLQLAGCNYSLNDLITQILCGLYSEYTPIVVTLSEKEELTWIEFQTYLLSYESRLDQLSSLQNLSLNTATTNLATSKAQNNFTQENVSNWKGSNKNNRERGRGRNSNKPICQVCGKLGHVASVCYYRFNQNYMGGPPNQSN